MRKVVLVLMVSIGAAGTLLIASYATAGGGSHEIRADAGLIGYQENPALSTVASGTFEAKVANDDESFDWTESYSGLEGTVTQSHIHFAQRGVNGAIIVFLCSNLGNGPPGTHPCPAAPATISGTFDASDVLCGGCTPTAPAGQGIGAGEFDELIRAMDAGKTYANLHTSTWPGGEIRAQLNETGNPHD